MKDNQKDQSLTDKKGQQLQDENVAGDSQKKTGATPNKPAKSSDEKEEKADAAKAPGKVKDNTKGHDMDDRNAAKESKMGKDTKPVAPKAKH